MSSKKDTARQKVTQPEIELILPQTPEPKNERYNPPNPMPTLKPRPKPTSQPPKQKSVPSPPPSKKD